MSAVNHQKQYSNDVCNHECRKLCVCVCVYTYFNPKFSDIDVFITHRITWFLDFVHSLVFEKTQFF